MNALAQNKKQIKSYFVKALLACLVTAGALGIMALLAGSFGEFEGKVLATTVLIGTFSMLSLCYLTAAGKSYQWISIPGAVAATAFLIIGLFILWVWFDLSASRDWELFGELIKCFLISVVLAVTFAHVSLLLLLSGNPSKNVHVSLIFTLASIGFVAAVLVFMITHEFLVNSDFFMRWLGVFAIVDVVGTVATPVLARFGGNSKKA